MHSHLRFIRIQASTEDVWFGLCAIQEHAGNKPS
jgi:hypothetical protein